MGDCLNKCCIQEGKISYDARLNYYPDFKKFNFANDSKFKINGLNKEKLSSFYDIVGFQQSNRWRFALQSISYSNYKAQINDLRLKELQPTARKDGPDAILDKVRKMKDHERSSLSAYIDKYYNLSPILKLDKYTKIRDKVSDKFASLGLSYSFGIDVGSFNLFASNFDKITRYNNFNPLSALHLKTKPPISPEELSVKISFISDLELSRRRPPSSVKPILDEEVRKITFLEKRLKDGNGKPYKVYFKFFDDATRKLLSKRMIKDAFQVVGDLNRLMPGREVKMVLMLSKSMNTYGHYGHFIEVQVDIDLLSHIVHEMGHSVFDTKLKRWQDIRADSPALYTDDYAFSKVSTLSYENESWEIVDDSNYLIDPESDAQGHPYDNDTELFASGFTAFYRYPNQFLEAIHNEELPDSWRNFGKVMWVYMRDKVWNGQPKKVFALKGKDPFKEISFEDLTSSVGASSSIYRQMINDHPSYEKKMNKILDQLYKR